MKILLIDYFVVFCVEGHGKLEGTTQSHSFLCLDLVVDNYSDSFHCKEFTIFANIIVACQFNVNIILQTFILDIVVISKIYDIFYSQNV